jgi:YggT family protein
MGYIILGWFVFFGVIRSRENVFFRIYVFLMSKVEPLFGWIRQFLPTLGGWDFSPLVLFIVLHFLKVFLYKFFLLAIS